MNALSLPGLGASELYNNLDLEKELELLAEDDIKQEMNNIGQLPDVPQTIKTNQENDPLRELEAWNS